MNQSVGIRSLAVSFPSVVRTNDYFRENFPELVASSEQKTYAKAFSPVEKKPLNELDIWTREMLPYLQDPFRGIVERRILGPGESSLTIEYEAAKSALEAANMSVDDLDLMIVTSMFPEVVELGDAAYLARELDYTGAAWNLQSTCSSPIIAFQTACALIKTGEYRNVLVVQSSSTSRICDENDTLSFFFADGAAAFVVSPLVANQGIISTKVINTSRICDDFFNKLAIDAAGNPRIFVKFSKNANKALRDIFVDFCRKCCFGAIEKAGLTLDQIDFFIFNTNTAWYSSTQIEALGIDPQRSINCNPLYANIGAPSSVVNLYHAAQSGRIRENDLVLMYSLGGPSNAAATIMRWGDVKLGPMPAPPKNPDLLKNLALLENKQTVVV